MFLFCLSLFYLPANLRHAPTACLSVTNTEWKFSLCWVSSNVFTDGVRAPKVLAILQKNKHFRWKDYPANDGLFEMDWLFVNETLYVESNFCKCLHTRKRGMNRNWEFDQSKIKIDLHHPSMLVHMHSKFHKILPAIFCQIAVEVDFSINQGKLL